MGRTSIALDTSGTGVFDSDQMVEDARVSIDGELVLSQQQVDALQRARIVRAVIADVAERGYGRATVATISASDALSRRTFYRYFANKGEAVAAAQDAIAAELERQMRAAQPPGAPVEERVAGALAAMLRAFDAHPEWGRVLIVEASGDGLQRRHMDALAAWLERVRERRAAAPAIAPREQAGALFGLLHARLSDGERPAAELLPALTWLVLGREVAAPPPPPPAPVALTREAVIDAACRLDDGALRALAEAHPAGHLLVAAARGGPRALLVLTGHGGRAVARTPRQGLRCLRFVAEHEGASNHEVAQALGFRDESQVSRLLRRLAEDELLEADASHGPGRRWHVTSAGRERIDRAGEP
jgi:AcrR family transcriptional regulator